VRRSRARSGQAGGNDDWLITYADTITLLLCLFVVLLVLQGHSPRLTEATPLAPPVAAHAVAVDFLDWKPSFHRGEAADEDADTVVTDRATAPGELGPWMAVAVPDAAVREPVDPPRAAVAMAEDAQGVVVGSAVVQPSVALPIPLPEIVARVQPDGAAHLEQQGDRITTIAFDSTTFFSRGSAVLSGSGRSILQEVVGNLTSEQYRDYRVTIEGHTDDAPISTVQFPSNWELSTARAAAVVRFFVEQGVSAHRLRAAGYADTQPLQPNRDGSGMAMAENQARNRRVVIGLEKIARH
jgi:chemotaxis protein MotB